MNSFPLCSGEIKSDFCNCEEGSGHQKYISKDNYNSKHLFTRLTGWGEQEGI